MKIKPGRLIERLHEEFSLGLVLTRGLGHVPGFINGCPAVFRIMEAILFGRGSESSLAGFDSAGIIYERSVPRPWQILNAGILAKLSPGVSWSIPAEVLVG